MLFKDGKEKKLGRILFLWLLKENQLEEIITLGQTIGMEIIDNLILLEDLIQDSKVHLGLEELEEEPEEEVELEDSKEIKINDLNGI